jgi:multidrug efflux pump subunit AcrA (membrane-fusion protein)
MTERTRASWLVYLLGALCAGAIVAAVLVVGPASGSQATVTRTATVARGVVQSTVSGSGNLQAASQLDLGFKTGGTVTAIYVTQGQHVTQGQLLATLDPQSVEVTLEQAKASLLSAEANLAEEEETDGEGASSTTPAPKSSASKPGASTSTKTPTISAATREANLASARADVRSDKLTVQSDEQSVQDTKLYAPESGTIVSLSGQVGEVVSGSGTTRASSTGGSSSTVGTGAAGSGAGGATARSATGASAASSASSSGTSSSTFAVLSDLSSMQLVVALSESEIGSVKDGQIATVTVEALASSPEGEGRKLAARVREVALLSTSSSGAVSYDVTFELDQLEPGLRLGMSATAEVVVKQAEGLNVPTSAITADTVTVVRDGKQVRQRVVTGLAGNTSTIVLSGLKAGETVVLPSASTSSSATNILSRLGSRLGGAGGLGGGGLGGALGRGAAGAGGGALFRGGG